MALWTNLALLDLTTALNYIAEDNDKAAEKVGNAILEACSRLDDFPKMGRPGIVKNTRELIVPRTPYKLVYRHRQFVEIIRLLHDKQKWP